MDLICRRFIDLSSHYDVMSQLMMHDRVIRITSTIDEPFSIKFPNQQTMYSTSLSFYDPHNSLAD